MRLSAAQLGPLRVRAIHSSRWCKSRSPSLLSSLHSSPQRPPVTSAALPRHDFLHYGQIRSFSSTMVKLAAAERFLADKAAPYCSLNVAKSFELLRSVSHASFQSTRVHIDTYATIPCAARRRKNTHTTSAKPLGRARESFRASGHHRRRSSMTFSSSSSARMASSLTWRRCSRRAVFQQTSGRTCSSTLARCASVEGWRRLSEAERRGCLGLE